MARRRHAPGQVINKLREAEVAPRVCPTGLRVCPRRHRPGAHTGAPTAAAITSAAAVIIIGTIR